MAGAGTQPGRSRAWRRLARWVAEVRPLLGERRWRLVALAASSAIGGFSQALILVALVNIALALTAGRGRVNLALGAVRLGEAPVPAVFAIAAGLIAVVLLATYLTATLVARMSADVLASLRRAVFASFTEASWSLQAAESGGRFQELVTGHSEKAATVVWNVATLIVGATNLGALVLSALMIDALSALAILVGVSLLLAAVHPLARRIRGHSEAQAAAGIAFAEAVAEAVTLARDVRVFNVERSMRAWLGRYIDAVSGPYFRTHFNQRFVPSLFQHLAFVFVLMAMGLVYVLGAVRVDELGAVVLLLLRALAYAQNFQRAAHHLTEMGPYAEQLRERKGLYEGARVTRAGRPLRRIETVELEDAWFSYPTGGAALRGISVRIDRGQSIGVTGPSGGGKSTLVQLLLRLRDPERGRYLVNGSEASCFDLDDWYRRVAFVAQEPRLSSGSVRDNIRFLREGVGHAGVERAARLAHIHDEILDLERGYDTDVGEHGKNLSVGQRQRVCLARALVTGPELLILDEPTSALDMRSEAAIQRTLEELRGNVTLVLVAHHLSTLSGCDHLMVLERGQLTAFGPPELIRDTNAFYRDALRLSRLD